MGVTSRISSSTRATRTFKTAMKPAALHAAGIIRHLHSDPHACAAGNVDRQRLIAFARSVATFVGHSPDRPFALTTRGEPDVALFDFAKRACDLPCRCLEASGRRPRTSYDSAIGPFWPLGTGSNRAVVGAYDACHATRFAASGATRRVGGGRDPPRAGAVYSLLKQPSGVGLRPAAVSDRCGVRNRYTLQGDGAARVPAGSRAALAARLTPFRRRGALEAREGARGSCTRCARIWDDEQGQRRAAVVRPVDECRRRSRRGDGDGDGGRA